MKQMVCSVCTFTYDEAKGIPESAIAPGTKWEQLPEDWKCPWCGAGKDAFKEKKDPAAAKIGQLEKPHVEKELSPMEMSIICSNLARGCEKQYLPEQSEAFTKLAEFFRGKAEPVKEVGTDKLLELIEKDLAVGYPYGNAVASEKPDRGALRCQVWSEKVTRMLQSLLTRYEAEGDKMLENTGVFVCTICGFVYLGNSAPALCPVCKVPDWKFEKMERRA
ncbi:MAG: rubredoxin [Oscillospiraceae bacterium]|nr:rubredoxin [Oscillospiraceae bacterium]